jgi:RNA polymerase sigma-70 factor (ECF subfamily)
VTLSVAIPVPSDSPYARAPAEALDFGAVYDELFPFVWRVARRMGVAPSALDDVCQDVFVVVHRRLPEFEGRSSLRTWVFGILMNVVQVHRRTLARKSPAHRAPGKLVDAETLVDDQRGPEDELTANEAVRIAHALLDQLDDDKRTVFVLAELEEMPVTEIARAVRANVNTVHARLRAARRKFAAAAKRHRAKDLWRMK